MSSQMLGVLDCRDLSECQDLSKLRGVLECCEGFERHEVSVCVKCSYVISLHFVSSQMLWGLRLS